MFEQIGVFMLEINTIQIENIDIDRFLDKIEIDPETECWNWTGGVHRTGYGMMWLKGKYVKPHRFGYIIGHQTNIHDLYIVCHKCDNRRCCNPSHLFLGSHNDNNQDMMNKGRHRSLKGEDHKGSLLTDVDVRQILIDTYNGIYSNVFEIAEKYNVSHHTIHAVLDGKRWTHITSELSVPLLEIKNKVAGASKSGRTHAISPFSDLDIIRSIKQRLLNGESTYALAEEFNVNVGTMYNIKKGKTYKEI